MTNLLFHNEGDGRFRDVSQRARIAEAVGKGMGVAFNDYDQGGFTDIFVSNDGMEQFLFRNKADGSFDERALEANVALSDDGIAFASCQPAFPSLCLALGAVPVWPGYPVGDTNGVRQATCVRPAHYSPERFTDNRLLEGFANF